MGALPAVSITAYSVCSALGAGVADHVRALAMGRGALQPAAPEWNVATYVGALGPLADLPGELRGFDSRLARLTAQLLGDLMPDLRRARERWGAGRVAVLLGTSNAGIHASELAHAEWLASGALPPGYDFAAQHAYDGILHIVQRLAGLSGPAMVVSTACSSGAKVLATAQRWIAAGRIDAALVGGVDTLCGTTLHGFASLGAISAQACRPFDRDRDGISIGEGGGLLLLERGGDARVRLLAVGESCDAHHLSAPHPEGAGAEAAMRRGLALAGLAPEAVAYVNAHGTATPLNDIAEGLAIQGVFGDGVQVSSTKGYTGHLLGAAGAVEAVLSALCLENGLIPGNLGCTVPDPAIPVRLAMAPASAPLRVVVSNSFAFGGNNAAVVLGAA